MNMSITTVTRNGMHQKQQMKAVLDAYLYNATRNITAADTSEKYEDPALANAKPFEEIPSLPIFPIIGSAWVYFPIIGRYKVSLHHKADLDKHRKYGDIVREKLGPLNLVSSFVPETMETFVREEGPNPRRGEFTTLKQYRQSRPHWYKSTGLLVLEGKEWYELRSRTQKHLMKPKAVTAYLDKMQEVAGDLRNLIQVNRDSNKEVPDFLLNLYKWALESVSLVGLDTRLYCLNPNLPADSDGMKMINSVQTQFECMNKLESFTGNFQFWKFLPSPTWRKFEKESDIFSEIAFKYINRSLENLKQRNPDDELTLLQSMLMEKGLDVSGAMVTVSDMLMAGIDTTSHTIGFLLYLLAKNPEKQDKLFKEIQELLPRKEDKITPDIFNKLHYLKACLKESIRLMPISRGNTRTFDKDVVISGYRIPAGTVVFSILQVVYRNEKYFKNADKFIPERWLSKEEKPANPYAYLPFGMGVRSCIGRRLAELEMICLTTEILRNFKVEYHHEDIDMLVRLVNVPDRPLRFTFLDR